MCCCIYNILTHATKYNLSVTYLKFDIKKCSLSIQEALQQSIELFNP